MTEAKTFAENGGRLIGRSIDRVDGRLKVTGTAKFAAEHEVPGLAYGFVVESTIARGRIEAIDATAAERSPGVLAVLTHLNAPQQAGFEVNNGTNTFDRPQPVLNTDRITHHGQYIALVVADTYENARAAAARVKLRYAVETPALDFEIPQSEEPKIVDRDVRVPEAYEPKFINIALPADTVEGNFDRAFALAPIKIDATYLTPYEHNNPMEPHATIAMWEGDVLTLYDSSQNVMRCRKSVAATLRIPEVKVRVVSRFAGGGFGSKALAHQHVIMAAIAAQMVGRPVKIVLTRQQMFPIHYRSRTVQRMRFGATRDGVITAVAHESWVETSTYDEFVESAGAITRSMYAGPNRVTRHRVVRLNLPTPNIMRAPGEAPGSFALESAMDELALALDWDPIQLRIRNEPTEDPEKHVPFSSRSLIQCLRVGGARFGWKQRVEPRSMRDGRWLIGCGVASASYPTYLRPSSARVVLTKDGRVLAQLAAAEIGVGAYTALAQIAAETLGLDIDKVTIELGDSNLPPAAGSGGSFGLASAGSGLYDACLALRVRLAGMARSDQRSPLYGLNLDDITFANGNMLARNDSGRGEPMMRLVERSGKGELEAQGHISPDADQAKRYSMHAYGAQFAEVAVDEDTGEVRLRRMLGAFAAGRIINTKTAHSQLVGGMIWGVGQALHEETVVDPRFGHFVNRDLAEYHVPVHADTPEVDAIFVDEQDDKVNPLGAKGLGELGIVGAAAAVANAVFHATGKRVRELPITLDKLL
jgi:xanthine dehydrogenase YagR molybdenum-binding subunit